VRETLKIVFGLGNVEKAVARVDTRNEGSMALLSRLRFQRAQMIKAADFFKGRQSDEWEYELHRREWDGINP